MRNRLTVYLLLLVALVFALLTARQMWVNRNFPREKFAVKKFRVLTYSSFVGSMGPGGDLIERFKKAKNCEIEVLTATDAGLLLERLKLAQASLPVDAVIGLDQLQLADEKVKAQFSGLVSYDWSPMTFIYRKGEVEPPVKFADLTEPRFKGQFALQNPRASTPGMQFYDWVRALEGDRTGEFLSRFEPNVQSISPSWAFSYGLFEKKQAKFVFSYLTSLAFHWGTEKNRDYQAVSFPEGHPVQMEYAGVPEGCRECELGGDFVASLLEIESQKLIMEKNYMFPAVKEVLSGTVFAQLPQLKTLDAPPPSVRDLSDWDKVFNH